ncbi:MULTISPECIES: SCO family protein [unclassified Thalassospira]|uniref:SCO family protein n=1 Tax=unclassified Thalassospira TaxID=2648997 RepID=UPI000A24938D|nr:SCO family protein [Thalassospira sp. MCCC 1A01428]OSQ45925.1 electron transporter SenC [Thalassospira sp. MCCC 1A01428]
MNRRTWLIIIAIIVVLTFGFGFRLYNMGRDTQAGNGGQTSSSGVASIGGPFNLIDQNGKARTEQDFRGEYMLVYFGYTYCPDVCPTELQAMSNAMDILPADVAKKVQPIFISVDPERDTVAAMADYVPHFHPRLIGLTGSLEQTSAAAKAYRVYYSKAFEEGEPKDSDTYLVDHSSFIYLMGPNGAYVRHFNYGETPEKIAEGIEKVVETQG